jgi:hypothetical protein
MTPTWPSTAAGIDGGNAAAVRSALICGWLRRAIAEPAASAWILRGSVVTAALCPGARAPGDVDYLVPGDATTFDPSAMEDAVRMVCDARDAETSFTLASAEVIWGERRSPGLRAHVRGGAGAARGRFQVYLAVGDPMCVPPVTLAIAGVGDVRAVAPETLFAWKLHGLAEFGPGKWRAKDLFDLDLLWRHAALDRGQTVAAVELAFASRGLGLAALDAFRMSPSWGLSRRGARKWRTLGRAHPTCDELVATRDRVRAAVEDLLS